MSQITLRDKHLNTIGYIRTRSDGVQEILDEHLRLLGYYNPTTNITTDHHFSQVGYGNLLTTLLPRK